MNKAYNRTIWRNDTEPALNEANLNKESAALDVIDDRVIELYNRTENLEGYQVEAQKAVTDAQNIASQMEADAQIIESQMAADAQAAREALAQDSGDYINQSKSWAIGEGYPQRTDQATNNAKYFALMAEQIAADNGYVNFEIDGNGHLIYVKTSNVNDLDFEIRDNANLFVVVNDGV